MFTNVYPKTTNGGINAQGKLTSAEWNGFIEELVGEFEYTPIATVGIIVEPIQGEGAPDLSAYALKSWVEAKGYLTAQNLTGYATEEYVNNAISAATGADLTAYLTKTEAASTYLTSQSLKTINGNSLVGTGDITISGGGGSGTVDSALNNSSTNPVQNNVIYAALEGKASLNGATFTGSVGIDQSLNLNKSGESISLYVDYDSDAEVVTLKLADIISGYNLSLPFNLERSGVIALMSQLPTIDSALSNSSTNPLQNKAIYSALQGKVTRTDVGQIHAGNIEMLTDGYGKYYGVPESHVRDEADYILATEDYVDNAVSSVNSIDVADVLIPNFDGLTPIKTIEFDKAAANYSQLFTRKNTGISTIMSEVQDVVLMRITVTGTNIYSRSDVIIKFQPGLVNPHAYAFHHTYSGTAATTGIMYLRFNYPKALNNDIPWMVDFYQYNATSRHYKIEVFATTENITWEETLTSTTYNSTNYGTAQITLYANRGLVWLGTLLGHVNTANAAGYINNYLPKFVSANVIKAGEALVAYDIAFFNKGFAYKISNKDVAIDTDCGVCSIGTTYALNAVISYAYLRSIWSFTFTSPANHGLTNDIFAQGDRVYLRCTMRNGKIYSDAHLAKEMTPGYTWYLLGAAYNATNGLDMNTTGSMFITLDESGCISHINGKPTQAALMVDGVDQENTFLKRSAPVGRAEVKNIGGNSVVWNQMMPNTGSTSPYTGVQGVTLGRKDGNVLYISGNAASAADLTFPTYGNITTIVSHVYLVHLDKEMPKGWYTGLAGTSVGTTTYGKSHITTCTSSNSYGVYICRTKNTPTGVDIDWESHVCVFDLTQMFGAGNEPDTLEEFERMFPEPYYEYDEGTLLNLEMTSIKTEDSSGTQVSNVNFNVKTLQGIPSGGNAAETIFPNGLCGIGGVRDEIDFEAGKAIKRFGMVDIGSLTYTTDSYGFYTQQITDSKPYSSATPVSNLHILVNGYTKINVFSATVADKSVTLNASSHAVNKLYLRNNAYSTAADFKTAMSGVMLVYELAQPIEYTITADVPTYNTVKGGCEKILPYDDDDALTAPATMLVHYENKFQEKLVSGENIKTVNNQSLLGSGNITIQGGGSGDVNVIEVVKVNGTALTPDANKAVDITVPAAITETTVSGWGFTKNTGTITGITMNGASKGTSGVVDLGTVITSETALSKGTTSGSGNAVTDISVSGHQITLTKGKTFLESETDPVFSASVAASITSSDITNWNGKTSNVGTVTGVKMNGTTNNPTSGVVDLGTVLTSHQTLKTLNNESLTGSGNISITSLPSVTSSDNGDILQVVSGAWAKSTPVTVYSGSSAPSSSLGNNGDIYIQTS